MTVIKCPGCGSMISTKASVCPKCGYATNGSVPNNSYTNNGGTNQPYYPSQQPVQQNYPPQRPTATDEPKVILCIFSFLFSIVGWVLYFVYIDDAPNSARAYSRWAWAGFALWLVSVLIGSGL